MRNDLSETGASLVRSSLERTPAGLPLSANRAPADDLKPWVARVFTTAVEMTPAEGLQCSFLSDSPALRMLFSGRWEAGTMDGFRTYERETLLFGPQSRAMPVMVEGSFSTLTVILCPGATRAFDPLPLETTVDRILPLAELGLNSEALFARFEGKEDPEERLLEIEQVMREYIARKGAPEPDPITTAFDMAALADPNLRVGAFAEEQGVAQKTIERIVKRDFGMTPKMVLRRARALDMAATLCGVADKEEVEELALRYFDQSHLTRDFLAFFAMSPTQFAAKPRPLMTLALEVRQARRLELLGRLDPGERRPWQA